MPSYQIQLLETRLSKDDIDDVALFDVTQEEDGRTWRVAAILSPLFRLLHMTSAAPLEDRRDMVAGLGARAIVEGLQQGREFADREIVVFIDQYPGAPGAPEPMLPYDRVQVSVDGAVQGA